MLLLLFLWKWKRKRRRQRCLFLLLLMFINFITYNASLFQVLFIEEGRRDSTYLTRLWFCRLRGRLAITQVPESRVPTGGVRNNLDVDVVVTRHWRP